LARKRRVTGDIVEKCKLDPKTAELLVETIGPNQFAKEAAKWGTDHEDIPGFRTTLVNCLDTSRGPTNRREISNLFDQIEVALPQVETRRLPSFLRGALTALDAKRRQQRGG